MTSIAVSFSLGTALSQFLCPPIGDALRAALDHYQPATGRLNSAGPGELSLIAAAINSHNGEAPARTMEAMTTSIRRFVSS